MAACELVVVASFAAMLLLDMVRIETLLAIPILACMACVAVLLMPDGDER